MNEINSDSIKIRAFLRKFQRLSDLLIHERPINKRFDSDQIRRIESLCNELMVGYNNLGEIKYNIQTNQIMKVVAERYDKCKIFGAFSSFFFSSKAGKADKALCTLVSFMNEDIEKYCKKQKEKVDQRWLCFPGLCCGEAIAYMAYPELPSERLEKMARFIQASHEIQIKTNAFKDQETPTIVPEHILRKHGLKFCDHTNPNDISEIAEDLLEVSRDPLFKSKKFVLTLQAPESFESHVIYISFDLRVFRDPSDLDKELYPVARQFESVEKMINGISSHIHSNWPPGTQFFLSAFEQQDSE